MFAEGTMAKLKTQSTCKNCFPEMVSVISGSSHHSEVGSSFHFSDRFGFKYLFDAIKRGLNVVIDS